MDWRVKVAIQFAISRIPHGARLNQVLQDLVAGRSAASLQEHVLAVAKELAWAEANGLCFRGARVAEVGTGRTPVATLLMAIMGARVDSYDRLPLLTVKDLRQICEQLGQLAVPLATVLKRPQGRIKEIAALGEEQRLEGILETAGIRYHAPASTARTELATSSIDALVSFDVLEHLNREELAKLNLEARRIVKSTGLQFHVIGLGDHYASLDSSITSVHFLKYSERVWQFWTDNSLSFHNRIRLPEFLDIFWEADFEAAACQRDIDPAALEALRTQPVAVPFQKYSKQELAVHRASVLMKLRKSDLTQELSTEATS